MFEGGYYTIEQKGNKLRIIALNSNAFLTLNQNVDPNEQLEWLEKILNKSVKNKETVSIKFNNFWLKLVINTNK